jgi:hypothetical protein
VVLTSVNPTKLINSSHMFMRVKIFNWSILFSLDIFLVFDTNLKGSYYFKLICICDLFVHICFKEKNLANENFILFAAIPKGSERTPLGPMLALYCACLCAGLEHFQSQPT